MCLLVHVTQHVYEFWHWRTTISGRICGCGAGSIAIAGAGVSWLRDNLGALESASQSEELAASVPDTAGACQASPCFSLDHVWSCSVTYDVA